MCRGISVRRVKREARRGNEHENEAGNDSYRSRNGEAKRDKIEARNEARNEKETRNET